jgi:hypothetical protein
MGRYQGYWKRFRYLRIIKIKFVGRMQMTEMAGGLLQAE